MDNSHIKELKVLSSYLTELESDLAIFFNNTPDLMCVIDNFNKFSRVNPAWTRALGWSKDELVGRSYLEFVHPEDLVRTHEVAKQHVSTGKIPYGYRNRYLHKDGSYRVLEWTTSLFIDNGFCYAIARDVTDTFNEQLPVCLLKTPRCLLPMDGPNTRS